MGKRIHIVKKVEEYASMAAFNYRQSEFESLLSALGCYVNVIEEGNSDRFEVPTGDYEKALVAFRAYMNGEEMPEDSDADDLDVDDAVKALAYEDETRKEAEKRILKNMEDFYESRDKDFDWMIFVSW